MLSSIVLFIGCAQAPVSRPVAPQKPWELLQPHGFCGAAIAGGRLLHYHPAVGRNGLPGKVVARAIYAKQSAISSAVPSRPSGTPWLWAISSSLMSSRMWSIMLVSITPGAMALQRIAIFRIFPGDGRVKPITPALLRCSRHSGAGHQPGNGCGVHNTSAVLLQHGGQHGAGAKKTRPAGQYPVCCASAPYPFGGTRPPAEHTALFTSTSMRPKPFLTFSTIFSLSSYRVTSA